MRTPSRNARDGDCDAAEAVGGMWNAVSRPQIAVNQTTLACIGTGLVYRGRDWPKVDQPEHPKALHFAKATGAVLVIAKLPEANDLTAGIMAVVALAEREAISRRTKEALAVAKARRVKLRSP